MSTIDLPLIIEADELEKHLGEPGLVIVDLTKPETYSQYHIPGAVFLEYPRIIHIEKPVMGMLPDDDSFSLVLSSLGITADTHVVAYDDEGGGKASRLLWTLDVFGHRKFSLLNGGLHAWANEGHPLDNQPVTPTPSHYHVSKTTHGTTTMQYILDHLKDEQLALLDTRSVEEFTGAKKFSERGGHIPGAVNIDWVNTMDRDRNLRLLPEASLNAMLAEKGISPDKEVIVYCQSHHRSAHTYILLKSLGYENIKGYPGAWSEWGNQADTPVSVE